MDNILPETPNILPEKPNILPNLDTLSDYMGHFVPRLGESSPDISSRNWDEMDNILPEKPNSLPEKSNILPNLDRFLRRTSR